MKFLKIAASLILFISMGAQAEISSDDKFLEPKKFKKFTFTGCVITVDQPSAYIYINIASTVLFSSLNQVSIYWGSNGYSEKMNNKDEFIKEYIYRQNYCSHIKK